MLAGRLAKLNDIADSEAYMVPPEQTLSEIGSDYYKGGMVVKRAGGVHPAKLHAGVLRVAPRGRGEAVWRGACRFDQPQ